jgi:hypothetical protein
MMTEESFPPGVNRVALIVKIKKPFVDWLIYTSKEYDRNGHQLREEDIQMEGFDSKSVYLIPAYDENEQFERFVKRHHKEIFEHQLSNWYTLPDMWPKIRSWKVFQEWLDYEIQTLVYDMFPKEPLDYEH